MWGVRLSLIDLCQILLCFGWIIVRLLVGLGLRVNEFCFRFKLLNLPLTCTNSEVTKMSCSTGLIVVFSPAFILSIWPFNRAERRLLEANEMEYARPIIKMQKLIFPTGAMKPCPCS